MEGLSRFAPTDNLFDSGAVIIKTCLKLKPKPVKTLAEVKPLRWLADMSQTVLSWLVLAKMPSEGSKRSPLGKLRSADVGALASDNLKP